MPPPLILASTSPYRAAQLRRLGLDFAVEAPDVDEEEFKRKNDQPRNLAADLAQAKAEAVAARHPDAVVVAGDQIVALEGRLFGKPGSAAAAVKQLLALSGRTHELLSAAAVAKGRDLRSAVVVCRMTLRKLTRAEAERYVAADQPLDCAGSYKFEARGVALFAHVVTPDPSAIEGLPLMALCGLLLPYGFQLP